jgi:hypothetical protein
MTIQISKKRNKEKERKENSFKVFLLEKIRGCLIFRLIWYVRV